MTRMTRLPILIAIMGVVTPILAVYGLEAGIEEITSLPALVLAGNAALTGLWPNIGVPVAAFAAAVAAVAAVQGAGGVASAAAAVSLTASVLSAAVTAAGKVAEKAVARAAAAGTPRLTSVGREALIIEGTARAVASAMGAPWIARRLAEQMLEASRTLKRVPLLNGTYTALEVGYRECGVQLLPLAVYHDMKVAVAVPLLVNVCYEPGIEYVESLQPIAPGEAAATVMVSGSAAGVEPNYLILVTPPEYVNAVVDAIGRMMKITSATVSRK